MGTTVTRKLIDLPGNVIKGLQLRATTLGVSLKKYMEDVLIEKSEEELSDEQLYELILMMDTMSSLLRLQRNSYL